MSRTPDYVVEDFPKSEALGDHVERRLRAEKGAIDRASFNNTGMGGRPTRTVRLDRLPKPQTHRIVHGDQEE